MLLHLVNRLLNGIKAITTELYNTIRAWYHRNYLSDQLLYLKLDHPPRLMETCMCHMGRVLYVGHNLFFPMDFSREEFFNRNVNTNCIPYYDFSEN